MAINTSLTLKNNFPLIGRIMHKRLGEALTAAGEDLVVAVQANMVPGHAYDTGYMHDHTTWEQEDETHGRVHVDADYAAFVEFGTVKMVARPFMHPAIAEGWPKTMYLRAVEIGAKADT